MGEADLEKLDSSFLGYGAVLENELCQQRNDIAAGVPERLKEIYAAQSVLQSCFGSILGREDRAFEDREVTQKVHRAAIHTAIVQGAFLTSSAICTASYAQAATLVRQELEAASALIGLRNGTLKEGKPPNAARIPHMGRNYGFLSGLAHLSRSRQLIDATDALKNGIDHSVNVELEKHLFCIHLFALGIVCIDAAELRPYTSDELFCPQERVWFQSVCGLLSSHGYLTVKTD